MSPIEADMLTVAARIRCQPEAPGTRSSEVG